MSIMSGLLPTRHWSSRREHQLFRLAALQGIVLTGSCHNYVWAKPGYFWLSTGMSAGKWERDSSPWPTLSWEEFLLEPISILERGWLIQELECALGA